MKTLREAYESIGTLPQVGDIIERLTWRQIVQSVDGWYFTERDTEPDICYSAAKIEGRWFKYIERNGKQIYPKVEKALALPAYYKEGNALIKFYAERLNVDIIAAQELTNLLFDYVCAIIEYKESK